MMEVGCSEAVDCLVGIDCCCWEVELVVLALLYCLEIYIAVTDNCLYIPASSYKNPVALLQRSNRIYLLR